MIPFSSYSKEEQGGEGRRKRMSWHCYVNPLDWAVDYMYATFEYLACFPKVIAAPNGPLFPASNTQQSNLFYNQLKEILLKNEKGYKMSLATRFQIL